MKQIADKATDRIVMLSDWENSVFHLNPSNGIDFLDLEKGFPHDHPIFAQLQDVEKMAGILNETASETLEYPVLSSAVFLDELHYEHHHVGDFYWNASVAVSQENLTLNRHEIRFYSFVLPNVKINLDDPKRIGSTCTFTNGRDERTRGFYINVLKNSYQARKFSLHEMGHHIQDSIMKAPSDILARLATPREIDQYHEQSEKISSSSEYFKALEKLNLQKVHTYTCGTTFKKEEVAKECWGNIGTPYLMFFRDNQDSYKKELGEKEALYHDDIREVFANDFSDICQMALYKKAMSQKRLKSKPSS